MGIRNKMKQESIKLLRSIKTKVNFIVGTVAIGLSLVVSAFRGLGLM